MQPFDGLYYASDLDHMVSLFDADGTYNGLNDQGHFESAEYVYDKYL